MQSTEVAVVPRANQSVAISHREQILERLSQGEYMKDIAISMGVTKQAVSQVLKDDPEYLKAREDGMAERLDKAHQLMAQVTESEEIRKEDAKEYLDLVRIREAGLKRLEWRAEREFPSRWGAQKMNINIIQGVTMDDALASEAGNLLEHITKS